MKPIRLQVIAPTFGGLGICTSCELVLGEAGVGSPPAQRAMEEYPPEWQKDARRLTDWVYDLAGRYGERILIKVIDPQSPGGLLQSLRYRVRRYPTWIVDGATRIVGWDRDGLEAALHQAAAKKGHVRRLASSREGASDRFAVDRSATASVGEPLPGIPRGTAWLQSLGRFAKMIGEMIYGASIYEMVRDLNKERGMIERLFILVVFGDVLGVPILPPYYALRLLPYVAPNIGRWRTSMLRERDLTDLCDQEFT